MQSIHAKSRDNARTPMQWSGEENAGFSTGKPWMKVNPNYTQINAEQQMDDPDSVFAFYQTLIRLRKTNPVFREGSFRLLLADNEDIFAYTRTTDRAQLLIVCNFHGKQSDNPLESEEKAILCNYSGEPVPGKLRPFEALIYLR